MPIFTPKFTKRSTLPSAEGRNAGTCRMFAGSPHISNGVAHVPVDRIFVTIPIFAIADAVDASVFVATRPVEVIAISEVHSVAGSAGTAQPRKCTGTQAPSAGAALTTAAALLDGTANTVQNLTLSATAADLKLAAGDRIALDITGTPTGLAGGSVTIELRLIG